MRPILLLTLAFAWLALLVTPAPAESLPPYNHLILRAVAAMPKGGGYSVSADAANAFRSSVGVSQGRFLLQPRQARPSFCSSATYLVLLRVLDYEHRRGQLALSPEVLQAWTNLRQADGHGIWGRWNANGPGAACLLHDLQMGRSFTSLAQALPGDFLKLFWREAVGKQERGHLVVYLGKEMVDGVPHVRFWSSNQPDGYGEKSVPLSSAAHLLFTRLTHPENIRLTPGLPPVDAYLESLLRQDSSFPEALRQCGAR